MFSSFQKSDLTRFKKKKRRWGGGGRELLEPAQVGQVFLKSFARDSE